MSFVLRSRSRRSRLPRSGPTLFKLASRTVKPSTVSPVRHSVVRVWKYRVTCSTRWPHETALNTGRPVDGCTQHVTRRTPFLSRTETCTVLCSDFVLYGLSCWQPRGVQCYALHVAWLAAVLVQVVCVTPQSDVISNIRHIRSRARKSIVEPSERFTDGGLLLSFGRKNVHDLSETRENRYDTHTYVYIARNMADWYFERSLYVYTGHSSADRRTADKIKYVTRYIALRRA